MPIFIGDKEIATVFKGDTELDNIQLGNQQQWIGQIVTPNPSITYISRTTSSLTFDLTNNHEMPVTIYYEIDDNTPDANTIVVSANGTERVTLSGLNQQQTYTLFIYALETDQLPSETISNTQTTQGLTANPSILSVNPSSDSVTFSLRNNDNNTATIYYEVNDSTPDLTVSVGAGQTVSRTISGLSASTNYTIYARAQASGEVSSSTVSTGFTTDAPPAFTLGTINFLSNNNSSPFNDYGNFAFSADGSKLFYTRWSNYTTTQHNLSTPFDVTTAGSTVASLNVGPSSSYQPRGTYVSPDGLNLYIVGSATSYTAQYKMSSPNNLSTASLHYELQTGGFSYFGAQGDIWFSPNGTKMFIADGNTGNAGNVYEHDLSTAWELSSASYTGRSFNFNTGSNAQTSQGLAFNNTGTRFFTTSGISRSAPVFIQEFSVTTPFTLIGASYVKQTPDLNLTALYLVGLWFTPNGNKLFTYSDGYNTGITQWSNSGGV